MVLQPTQVYVVAAAVCGVEIDTDIRSGRSNMDSILGGSPGCSVGYEWVNSMNSMNSMT